MDILGVVFPIAVPAGVVVFCLIMQERKEIARRISNLFKRKQASGD